MLITFTRAIVLYLIVLIVMRLMGKRQIGELQPFELAISIMIADLASVPMSELGIPLTNGIIPNENSYNVFSDWWKNVLSSLAVMNIDRIPIKNKITEIIINKYLVREIARIFNLFITQNSFHINDFTYIFIL